MVRDPQPACFSLGAPSQSHDTPSKAPVEALFRAGYPRRGTTSVRARKKRGNLLFDSGVLRRRNPYRLEGQGLGSSELCPPHPNSPGKALISWVQGGHRDPYHPLFHIYTIIEGLVRATTTIGWSGGTILPRQSTPQAPRTPTGPSAVGSRAMPIYRPHLNHTPSML